VGVVLIEDFSGFCFSPRSEAKMPPLAPQHAVITEFISSRNWKRRKIMFFTQKLPSLFHTENSFKYAKTKEIQTKDALI